MNVSPLSVRKFAALLCLCTTLVAQEQNPAPPRPAAPAPVTVTLTFSGGTLEKFVREVRLVQPKANIVVAARAAEAVLPPIDLRGAGLEQALQGACEVAESDYLVRVRDYNGPGEPVYSIVTDDRAPRTTITARGSRQSGDDARIVSRVFSVSRVTDAARQSAGVEPLRVETVLSAIEAATQDDKVPPVLRYHRDSGLLIVRGTAEQQVSVEMVLSVLQSDRPAPRASRDGGEAKQPATKDR